MQKNMERAISESGFGSVENDSVDNLFIVSEPEAAAAYVLASTNVVLVSQSASPLQTLITLIFAA
jgi:hypothetical protein